MITIYDKTGTAKLSVPISDKTVYYKGVSEEEYVNLAFNFHEVLQLTGGDYIDCEFGRFEIVKVAKPEDKTASDDAYIFEQHFNPRWWRATCFKLFYNRQAGYEASWKMTHYASYFMDIVVDNMRRAGIGEYTYVIDESITEMKLVTFDGVDIISGLSLIAEAWEAEWWFTDNVIHLGRCEYGEPVRMGMGEELADIKPQDSSDSDYATRLYIFGASRNLPQNYRRDESTDLVVEGVVERRLKLPEGIDHIDAWDNLAEEDVVEAIITTDEIYPRRTGTIATITTKQYTDTTENEDGSTTETKWNAFRFTDSGISFSEEYIIAGEELRIIFQSGKLAGMDFAVTFNPDAVADESSAAAQVWEIVRNDDYGVNLPTDDFAPEPGDTYILYGYDTSFVADHLLDDAEQELLEYGRVKIKKLAIDKSNYNCDTNPVRCAGYTPDADGVMRYNEGDVIDLDIGTRVDLAHPVYFPGSSHVGRIRSFEKHLDNRYHCTYSVGEAKGYSRTGQLADKVEALTYQTKQYFSSSSGSSVYLIKRQDSSVPSDHNAYSALRSRIEFMCRSVAEYVRTRWSFLKGISIGYFSQGSAGAQIDADGNAEVENVTARVDVTAGNNVTAGDKVESKRVHTEQIIADSNSDTATIMSSNNFDGSSALVGTGYGITKDGNYYRMAIDYLTVRKGMTVAELVIQEYKSVGGVLVVSACNGEIETAVQDGDSYWMINIKDWDKHPQFVSGDIIRCSRWDDATNEYISYIGIVQNSEAEEEGAPQHIYVHIVSGDATPQAGDNLVQFGNTTDATRQGLIIISTENGQPNITAYDGLDSADVVMLDKMCARLGDLNGIVKDGETLSGYGLWTNNLYLGSKAEETFKELIKIGGRNYALGTGISFEASVSTSSADWQDVRMYYAKGLTAGDVVNVSFDWSAVGADSATINKIKLQFGYGTETSIDIYQDATDEMQISSATGSYNTQMTIPEGVKADTIIHVRLRVLSNSVTSIIVSHLMVQKGDGDWNVAPEDAENALTAYKSEVSNQFEVTKQKFNSYYKATNSALGNLLLQTNQGSTGWMFSNGNVGDVEITEYEGGVMFTYNSVATPVWEVIAFQLRPEKIVEGATYTLSFDIMEMNSTAGVEMQFDICFTTGKETLLPKRNTFAQKTKSEEWVTFSTTFTASQSGVANGGQLIYLAALSKYNGQWTTLAIRNLKLEAGEVATPWAKAPEDVVAEDISAEVTALETRMSSIEQTNSSIEATVSQHTETLTSHGTQISDNTSKITQNANSITTEVTARTEGDAELESKITQTADSISLKINELGVAPLNYAYGTDNAVVINTFENRLNQVVTLYDVTGLTAGDVVSLSFTIRMKNIIFDTNGGTTKITFQFDSMFNYLGIGITLTTDSFKDIAADSEGYIPLRVMRTGLTVPKQGYTWTPTGNIYHDITPDIVGALAVRMDYIDSETSTDADGNTIDIGEIIISELKLEIGNECTAWTPRTDDLDTTLLDTGIDISHRCIVATADNFKIKNNSGMVTAEVDEDGNLSSNSLACRYGPLDGASTPNIADWNKEGDGIQRWYFPDGTIRAEIGWDDDTESMVRKYDSDGNLIWKIGDPAEFQSHSEPIWTPISLYYCGSDSSAVPRNTKSLVGNTYYRKTNTGDAATNNTVYKSLGSSPALIDDGWYTPSGGPMLSLAESTSGGLVSLTNYSRNAYHYVSGKIAQARIITWSENNSAVAVI